MKVIEARNVNGVFDVAMRYMLGYGVNEQSRNGPVLSAPEPVTTVYLHPRERVLFYPARDCNPFLHFFESLWMLAGRNDVAFLRQFTKNMDQFSDDGGTLNGAYGRRWRSGANGRGGDQIQAVIELLRHDPESRRAVITMWERDDLWGQASKDIPCNLSIAFRVLKGELHMTVFNRSNDMIWGAYGANVVHMSFLQEYVACALGVEVGTYTQVSNNFHLYPENPAAQKVLNVSSDSYCTDYYTYDHMVARPPVLLFSGGKVSDTGWMKFDDDLRLFLSHPEAIPSIRWSPFFRYVVLPLYMSHRFYKNGEIGSAIASLQNMRSDGIDWGIAAYEWLIRRNKAKEDRSPSPLPA